MSVTVRFMEALDEPEWPSWVLTRMAKAAVEALPAVRGAVICMTSDGRRTPVGASDPAARHAEQCEYTVGDGPGFAAVHSNTAVVAGSSMTSRWPVLSDTLLTRTAVRGTRAVPLYVDSGVPGAVLILYYDSVTDADDVTGTGVIGANASDIDEVAMLVTAEVARSAAALAVQLLLDDPITTMMTRRTGVDIAVGMVMADQRVTALDALAVMRGYSYSRDELVDDTATHLRDGRLLASSLR